MKNLRILLAFFLVVGLNIIVYAWPSEWGSERLSVVQQIALFSIGAQYIDAACADPAEIGRLFEGSIIPQTLVDKSVDYLTELNRVEGECFGNDKSQIESELLRELSKLPFVIEQLGLATELGAQDFFNCLVDANDSSSYDIRVLTANIFQCVNDHLDIRAFWYEVLLGHRRHHDIIDEPIITEPIMYPPVPVPAIPYEPTCFDSCLTQCNDLGVIPVPGESIPAH